MIGWKSTKNALEKLENLLTCKICDNLFSDPCSLEGCDHNFCRDCVEKQVGVDSKCPECGAFAWVKDLKTNRQLVNTVNACVRLRSLVGSQDSDKFDIKSDDDARWKPVSGCISDDFTHDVDLDKNLQTPAFDEKETTKNLDNITSDVFAKSLKTYSRAGLKKEMNVDSTNSTLCNSELKATKRKQANEKHIWKQAKKKRDWADGTISVYQQIKQSIDENLHFQFNSKDERVNNDSDNLFTNLRPRPTGTCFDKNSTTTFKIGARHCDGAKDCVSKFRAQKRTCGNTQRSSEAIEYMEQNKPVGAGRQSISNGQMMNKTTASDTRTPFKQGNKRKKNLECIVKRSKSFVAASSISKRNKRGETPLHVASIKGHVDTVRKLLADGADPNTKDHAGWTPLHEACNHGHVTIVELLLDHGAMIDVPGGFDHDVPLHDAVANGRVTIARLLVSRGASLDARNKQGLFPKDYAVTEEMQFALSSSPSNRTKAPLAKNSSSQLLNERRMSMSPKVLLATGLNAEQKVNLQECATVLNACIVTEFSMSVTHIVTATNERGVCPRTIKYLNGILTGKWIVGFDWISKCLRRKMWVPESLFEIKGTKDAMVEAPKRARINVLKQLPGLFDGCQFYFYGDFVPPHPSKDDLSQMITYSGGKILSREPKPDIDDTHRPLPGTNISPTVAYHAHSELRQYRCTRYVVYDPLAEKSPHIWCTDEVCTVPSTWIMDCASNFTILDFPS